MSGSFLLCSEPPCGSPVKARVLGVACQATLSLLTRLPTFRLLLRCSCTGRRPLSRGSSLSAFAGGSLCPAARPPALGQPLLPLLGAFAPMSLLQRGLPRLPASCLRPPHPPQRTHTLILCVCFLSVSTRAWELPEGGVLILGRSPV